MDSNTGFKRIGLVHRFSGAVFCLALTAGAQTQSAPAAQTPPPAPPPAAPWSLKGIDFSGFLDGYYGYNPNDPTIAANNQSNDLYNFDDRANRLSLSAAKLTLNHDPNPVGMHADLIAGRTNDLVHPSTQKYTDSYLEQAFISFKPPKTHGAELDFGQFVTSAGAEVIEAKDNWNYSRSILFAWAIPYYHFGLRSSLPVTKTWTPGLQVVNGWNDVVEGNDGVTIGVTSAYTKPKYTWDFNVYTGPLKAGDQKGYRNLIDSTLLLTPSTKFNAYINYDYGQNRTSSVASVAGTPVAIPAVSTHWQGIAVAAHEQADGHSAVSARYEYFVDNQGYATGTAQTLQEATGTYEYKWMDGLLSRLEYRHDFSDADFFHKGAAEMVDGQNTLTLSIIAIFSPKR